MSTTATRCRCLACYDAKGRDVVEYIMMTDGGLLYSDHYIVIRRYEAGEDYDDRGGHWNCPALRVRDPWPTPSGHYHEYIAPARWFRPVE